MLSQHQKDLIFERKYFLFLPGIVPEISRLFMSVNTNVVFSATWTLSNLDHKE